MAEVPIRCLHASLIVLREGNKGHETLLLKRAQTVVGEWCQVAGSIEIGEEAWQTALRELHEETGLHPKELYSADVCEQFYEADRDCILIAPVFVAFVDTSLEVKLNHEHSEYRWVSFDQAVEMVAFAGQRRVFRQVEGEFVKRRPSRHLRIEF